MEHRGDLELMARVLDRDPDAFEAVIGRMKCVPRMLVILNRKLSRPLDDHQLADVGQEVLIVVWRRLGEYHGRSSLEAWVYRICFNLLMNTLRKSRGPVATRPMSADLEGRRELTVDGHDPFEFEEVYAGLDRLPIQEADVVRLKHFASLTFQEVGHRLRIPENTAKTRYYRGITRLQEHLGAAVPGGSR